MGGVFEGVSFGGDGVCRWKMFCGMKGEQCGGIWVTGSFFFKVVVQREMIYRR